MTEQILTGVGAELKHAREASGLAVGDVAHRLKLLPRQIESLEHERFDRLPGPAIARTMVRNYARLLKLDPQPLEERMAPRREESPERAGAARHRERVLSSRASRRAILRYVGFAVVLFALIGSFAYEWHREKAVPVISAAVAPLRSEPAPQRVEEKPATAAAPAPAPAPAPVVIPVQAPAESGQPDVKPKPEAPLVRALPPGIHRLVLRMEEAAWLEVRDGSGRGLVSSLNPAGTERAVRGQPPFQLVIGNAAHVRLTYNGKPVDLEPYTTGEVARFTLP